MAAGLALGVALTLLSWLVRDKSAATAAAMSHVLEAASLGRLLPQENFRPEEVGDAQEALCFMSGTE